jgi:hypothetical protein
MSQSTVHTPPTNRTVSTTPTKGRLRYGSQPSPLDLADTTHLPSSLEVGRHVFEREVIDSRTRFNITEVKARYRRRVVDDIKRNGDSWQWHFKYRLPAGPSFARTLLSDAPDVRSYPPPRMPDFPRCRPDANDPPTQEPDWQTVRWECPPETPPALSCSPKALTFTHLSGTGSRRLANRLLAGGPDGQFDHLLRGVQKWTDAFLAAHDGHPYSIAVLGPPYNAATGEDVVYLTRLCNHPHAPNNTSSWMLGRIRGWLRANTDVETLVSLAGVDGNRGTVYEAAGFEYDGAETVVHPRFGEWTKHRWADTIQ